MNYYPNMKFFYRYLVNLILLGLLTGCKNPIEFNYLENQLMDIVVDTSYFDYGKGVANALKKAQQISRIKWIPKGGNIPKFGDDEWFYEGHVYSGLPYSSVKEINTYVCRNVSFYTFMSAVNNPKSRLYTVNLTKPPYHSTSSATYYGISCSQAVNYALGIDGPYACKHYPDIGFYNVEPQNIESIKICDVLWNTGHTMMVYDIDRDSQAGTVKAVTIFEVNTIKKYSKSEFLAKWAEGKYTLMRYKYLGGNLNYEPTPFVLVSDETAQEVVLNSDLCPDKGDRTCYRTDETVIFNVFNSSYTEVVVESESGKEIKRAITRDRNCRLGGLDPGVYSAMAINGQTSSEKVYFEVVDTSVSAFVKSGKICVNFSSQNASPMFLYMSKVDGTSLGLIKLSDSNLGSGSVQTNWPSKDDDCYVKVDFRGKYGIITNTPILVKK